MAVAAGPRNYHFDAGDLEVLGPAQSGTTARYHYSWMDPVPGLGRDGIGLNTDSPVVPEEQLPLQGAIAVRLGLPHEAALRASRSTPIRRCIEHRVGRRSRRGRGPYLSG
jgi:imidazolonepropionase-like amidohydrolase